MTRFLMKILLEGEAYELSILEGIFDDSSFYLTNKSFEGIISTVGYYYSDSKNEIVYMLPKVFMDGDTNKTVFGIDKDELINIGNNKKNKNKNIKIFKHKKDYEWIRQLTIYFYNSLKEFKKRHEESILLHQSEHNLLNSNIPIHEYSYLDLMLSFVNFYKKNKSFILFSHIQSISKTAIKTNWSKTVRKQLPLLDSSNQPIYNRFADKRKLANTNEELLVYYFSILNRFNNEHDLNLPIDKSYSLITGKAFESLQRNGLNKLKKIKHRYFSDVYKKMYWLCELYFTKNHLGSKANKNKEFITIDNYNIVFEDMVDKLFSGPIDDIDIQDNHGLSLKKLKNHPDGKIIDHIYADKSLIDNSNIFYIGDSKYYKPSNNAGESSRFKQFTYAKNVIQFNIDILNDKVRNSKSLRYRDEITEGYNITPNFFIYGYIDDYRDFDNSLLQVRRNKPIKSAHFPDRLFDRDTLFIHEYNINFLYVLKSYSMDNRRRTEEFRSVSKKQFRNEFIKFFNNPSRSGFFVIEKDFENIEKLKQYVDSKFKNLNGRCISIGNKLLIAKPYDDDSISKEDKANKFEFGKTDCSESKISHYYYLNQ